MDVAYTPDNHRSYRGTFDRHTARTRAVFGVRAQCQEQRQQEQQQQQQEQMLPAQRSLEVGQS